MIDRNIYRLKEHALRIVVAVVIGMAIVACANMASPTGGDYDFDPPVVVSSSPKPNALNVKKGRIEIIFDELVQVEKPSEKVIITPPQRNFPVIRAQNNKVVVEIKDTLKPNVTYTIDFTDAIVDNNEKNPLENFALSFSTGDVIDTLAISGKVLTADNLEPVSGIYVGIHSNMSDTAFTKIPFERISRTNEYGFFSIKGIAPGEYKIYALDDINRDYMYDNPDETIAFFDDVIVPSSEPAVRYDSIFNINTFAFDSLKEVNYTRFLPDDIVLRSFRSPFRRQYLQKHERTTDDLLSIYFGAPTDMPEVEVLDVPVEMSEWSALEKTKGNDTLQYWLTKPTMIAMDTIRLKVTYMATDTLNQLQPKTDTLSFVNRNKGKEAKDAKKEEKKKRKKKKDEKEEKEEIVYLDVKTNIASAFDIYKDIDIEFNYPLSDFEKEKLHLKQYSASDSVFKDIDFELIADSLSPRKFKLRHKWEHDNDYAFSLDSASIHAYNGLYNKKLESKFKIKSADKYGLLEFFIQGLPAGMPAFVEMLDKSDKVVRKEAVVDNVALFEYLNPGIYYARIVLDANNNGKWDTGEYAEGRQPEQVYYWNREYEIKEFWEMSEDWNITAVPQDKQKPLEITKNKPKDDSKRRREMKQRDAKNERNQRNNSRNQSGTNRNMNTNNNNYNSRNSYY